jgi:voltage-gated potassium channel
MATILLGGGTLFLTLEPERVRSLPQGIYYSWSLIFAEAPESFPEHIVLQSLFFLMPVLGLTVIIEGIIDFSLMLRDRRRYERSWCTMLASSFSDHIILVGFGKLGFRIFVMLRKLGEAVVVIERDAAGQFLEELRRDGSPLLIGDARREALLTEANVKRARSIILATDDDLANLEIALDAQHLAPGIRVVMRMFDQNMANKFSDGFKIHMAASTAALSAPTFVTSAVAPFVLSSFMLNDQLIAMRRWLVRRGDMLAGKTIGAVIAELGLGVVEHTHPPDPPRLFPPPHIHLEPGDGIVLQGPMPVLQRIDRGLVEVRQTELSRP